MINVEKLIKQNSELMALLKIIHSFQLNDYQELEVFIPFGTDDLINFRVSPTPHYFSDKERQTVYNERVKKKNWNTIWPNISIEFIK